ncbi:MAG: hypothetical protein GX975_04530 [Clostridiales bacterium]|nr:hypothetical protein [Clostridiales bacterium]
MGNSGKYEVIFETLYFEEGCSVVYGIRTDDRQVRDISTDKNFVEAMAESFNKEHLDPIHLLDAIEDMLP